MGYYLSFAVVGVGRVGSKVATELANNGAQVSVLTRKGSNKTLGPGIHVREVDYDNERSVFEALSGIDVVISTLSGDGFSKQPMLIDAAVKAKIKLFVPSEFGADTLEDPELASKTDVFNAKNEIVKQIESGGLPWLVLQTGALVDYCFQPSLGFDMANKKVLIYGDGNAPISLTTSRDAARFLAHILTKFTADKLANKVYRIEGDRKSFNEIIHLIEKGKGIKLEVDRQDLSIIQQKVAADTSHKNLQSALQLIFADGSAAFSSTDNDAWPNWNPVKADEFFAKYYNE